jgi:hypothetical protein
VREGGAQAGSESGTRGRAEGTAFERARQGLAVDEFHDQIGLIVGKPGIKQTHETRVVKPFEHARLASQTTCELGVVRAHEFERDRRPADKVRGAIDVRHAAAAE